FSRELRCDVKAVIGACAVRCGLAANVLFWSEITSAPTRRKLLLHGFQYPEATKRGKKARAHSPANFKTEVNIRRTDEQTETGPNDHAAKSQLSDFEFAKCWILWERVAGSRVEYER